MRDPITDILYVRRKEYESRIPRREPVPGRLQSAGIRTTWLRRPATATRLDRSIPAIVLTGDEIVIAYVLSTTSSRLRSVCARYARLGKEIRDASRVRVQHCGGLPKI